MNKKQLAELLNNTQHPVRIDDELKKQAKENGLVIVYGSWGDLMEFEGAIRDEFCCYEGGKAIIDEKGLLTGFEEVDYESEEDLEDYFTRKKNAHLIKTLWCKEDGYSWTYKTDISHETFEVLDEAEKYCRGIVFSLSDLSANKKPVIAVDESDANKFESQCAILVNAGYTLNSSSCGFVNSAEYDFCSSYHAVFVKNDLVEKAIKFYNSAACYFAEGVEFMTKEQIYDALKKEFNEPL